MRRVRWILILMLAVAATGPAEADGKPLRIGYAIGTAGDVYSDFDEFAAVVHATLNDPRGWALGGAVRFRRDERGRFRVTLATPEVVGTYPGCSRRYSCRVGDLVLINEARWRDATPTYPGRARLHPYRQMVINHEVGHALGFGHAACPGPGRPAPVMQQQSKRLGGCARRSWPSLDERRDLARRLRVRMAPIPPRLLLGRRIGEVALGDARAGVRARIGTPQAVEGDVERYTLLRLEVRYFADRVVAVATRSRADRTAGGAGVGVRLARLERAVPWLMCDEAGHLACVHVRHRATTAFDFAGGRVSSVRIVDLDHTPA